MKRKSYPNLYNKKEFSEAERCELVKRYQSGDAIQVLSKHFGCSADPIKRILKEEGVTIRTLTEQFDINKIDRHDPYYFDDLNSPNKAYLLGNLFADGYISETKNYFRLHIHPQDLELIDFFKKELQSDEEAKSYNGGKSVMIHFRAKRSVDNLVKLGCRQKKSLTAEFPEINPELVSHFIRGYFDGDGCVTVSPSGKKGKRISIYILGANNFIYSMKDKLGLEGISSHVRGHSNSEGISVLSIRKEEDCRKFGEYIYSDAEFGLKRKQDKFSSYFA